MKRLTQKQQQFAVSSPETGIAAEDGGRRHGQRYPNGVQICTPLPDGLKLTMAQAAKEMNVSVRSVRYARKVRREGIPEISDMLMAGKMSLHTAVALVALPFDEQREVLKLEDEKAIRQVAKNIRAQLKAANAEPASALELTLRIEDAIDEYIQAHPDTTWQQVKVALTDAFDSVDA